MAGKLLIPVDDQQPRKQTRLFNQSVARILNSLIRGGWIVQTGADTWELLGDSSGANIDGGAPDAVYLLTQQVDGGSPDAVYLGTQGIDGGAP